jgi:hypothetical protein
VKFRPLERLLESESGGLLDKGLFPHGEVVNMVKFFDAFASDLVFDLESGDDVFLVFCRLSHVGNPYVQITSGDLGSPAVTFFVTRGDFGVLSGSTAFSAIEGNLVILLLAGDIGGDSWSSHDFISLGEGMAGDLCNLGNLGGSCQELDGFHPVLL